MRLESPAFFDGERIPSRYTCDGEDASPPLIWSDPPEETESFALLCFDSDNPLGVWYHWGVYNIPKGARRLEAECPVVHPCPPESARQPTGNILQVINDFRTMGYTGPCPPPGREELHHYRFRLMALKVPSLDLPPTATCADLEGAARPHILDAAELTGLY